MKRNSESDSGSVRPGDPASGGHSFRRLRTDSAYRRRFILTVSVCYSYVMLGWVVLQIGTSLPDLQLLVRIDLETASWLFTSWSLGFVSGSLICGFLYDKWNRLALMMTASVGCAICSICLPYSASFPVMVIVRIMTGVFTGFIDTGANTIVPSIWGIDGRPFMQALYFAYTFGGILSPFATKPFMLPKQRAEAHEHNVNDITADKRVNETIRYSLNNVTDLINNSTLTTVSPTNSTIIDLPTIHGEATIHGAFLITGVLVASSAVPYLFMLCKGGFDKRAEQNEVKIIVEPEKSPLKNEPAKEDTSQSEGNIKTGKLFGKRKIIVLGCVAGVNFMYSATEDSLGDFLVTFCRDYLDWDNTSAVLLMSLYWTASCVGGLSGVVLVKVLGPTKLMFAALILWNCAFFASLIASLTMVNTLVWICIPASGFFMVLIIPTVISWTEENVCKMSGKVSALFMISSGTGITGNPNFIGYVMEEYSYVCLIYILLTESIICSFLYGGAYCARNFCKGPKLDVDTEGLKEQLKTTC